MIIEKLFREIELLQWMVGAQLAVTLTLVVLVFWVRFKTEKERFAARWREDFINLARSLEDRGQYEALLKLADDRIVEFSNDCIAHMFRGKALLKLGRLGLALEAFSRAKEIDAQAAVMVQTYIDEARSRMDGPKSLEP